MSIPYTFRLPTALKQRLDAIAKQRCLNRSQIVRLALKKFLEEWKLQERLMRKDTERAKKVKRDAK